MARDRGWVGCGEGLNVGGFLNKWWMLFGTGFLVFFLAMVCVGGF